MSCNSRSKTQGTWNDMEEMKYLLCAIECCQCPSIPPPPVCSVILPPRIEELPAIIPPQRPCCPPPPCCPPTPCYPPSCPISSPCCALPPPSCKVPIVCSPCCVPQRCSPPKCLLSPTLPPLKPCCPPSPLPCYPISYC
ncbi:unnamed protein product [Xylocopa violacea]|uniref:Sperm mitochondrial-associated cysteine-rich protein-like n=1 Tax=Xylocopa violacea TaxID=135666 RepID=A0ABP1NTS3_XYLVO